MAKVIRKLLHSASFRLIGDCAANGTKQVFLAPDPSSGLGSSPIHVFSPACLPRSSINFRAETNNLDCAIAIWHHAGLAAYGSFLVGDPRFSQPPASVFLRPEQASPVSNTMAWALQVMERSPRVANAAMLAGHARNASTSGSPSAGPGIQQQQLTPPRLALHRPSSRHHPLRRGKREA